MISATTSKRCFKMILGAAALGIAAAAPAQAMSDETQMPWARSYFEQLVNDGQERLWEQDSTAPASVEPRSSDQATDG